MPTVFLSGDVMTGRAVDQVLPHPGDPTLHEPHLDDARAYLRLAERANGPVPGGVSFEWPWGALLETLDTEGVDARVINLETSVTRCSAFAPGKVVHYRMTPENLPAVLAGRPDVCVLANNHVLDFGPGGLLDTLDALEGAGVRVVGAGRDLTEASRPAVVPVDEGRLVVVAAAHGSSGVPPSWAATAGEAGVHRLPDLSAATADRVLESLAAVRQTGDVVIFSVHWGSNWGYEVPDEQVAFAHALLDGGVHVVHGHSSHHPRPLEFHGGGVVLYGCGDLINDYEGISGHEAYRDELRLAHLVSFTGDGPVTAVRMVPFRAALLRLRRASRSESEWLRATLGRACAAFGTAVELGEDGVLTAHGTNVSGSRDRFDGS